MSSTLRFVLRALACHVATYFVAGIAAMRLADYGTLYARPDIAVLMRPLDDPWVAAGPAMQILRGLVLGLALRPVWPALRTSPRGWLALWGLLVGLAGLGATGAAPGSLEGIIYTVLPLDFHLRGWPEVLAQTLVFAWLLHRWERSPSRWLAAPVIATAALAIVASVLGVAAALGLLARS